MRQAHLAGVPTRSIVVSIDTRWRLREEEGTDGQAPLVVAGLMGSC